MNTEFNLVPYVGQSFFLLDLAIKSTFILVVAFVMTRLLRRASASVRSSVWSVAILAVLALPVINSCLPKWTIEASTVNHTGISHHLESPPGALSDLKFQQSSQRGILKSTPQSAAAAELSSVYGDKISGSNNIPAFLSNVATFLNVLWLTGVVVMLIRLFIMRMRLRTVSRKYEVVTTGRLFDSLQTCRNALGYSKPVSLLVTAQQQVMPMTWGIMHPSILLPLEAEDWMEHELHCALIHELAHVSRLDCLSQLFVQIACTLYWFNPLVWVAARFLHIERELACDDIVLQNGTRASDYATQLMQVVSRFRSHRILKSTAVSMAAQSGFAQRLKAILHETQDRRPVRLQTMVLFAISFIGLTGLLGTFPFAFTETAYAQQSGEQQSKKQQSKPEPIIQQSIAKPPQTQDTKLVPETQTQEFFNGRKRAVPVQGTNQPSPRSLNIVFAHDPGLGNYNGIVGGPNDVWNSVDIGTTAVDYTRYSDASSSTARLRISRHDGEWGIKGKSGIFQGYIYHNCRCVDLETKVLDLPAGKYKIYVFAHGDAPNQNAEIELKVGKRVVGRKATANDGTWNYRTQAFREGLQYVSFDFTIAAGEELRLISHRAGSDYSMFNAIQIVPKAPLATQLPMQPAPISR
ncbi:M56 family metallopeptidase [uncultured Gimesia sp.]|uniref:M56 family metallopeptidase n=1 Tax=uncultured Gimesia sp. TaxID=1678688 RepID=UPI0030D98B07|tara:strand:+ start:16243 stop:18147 length:1905 start_codon:yes stop_codon:yes gene_type:complete